jgi:hypothetical protein
MKEELKSQNHADLHNIEGTKEELVERFCCFKSASSRYFKMQKKYQK